MTLLEEDIEADILDRLSQLTTIKTLASRYTFSSQDALFWYRYSIPSIYSIWEGFFVTSMQTFIREINSLDLKLSDYKDHYLIHHTESSFKQLFSYPEKHNSKARFLTDIKAYFRSDDVIYINPVINTESNLGFEVMNKLLKRFNLNCIAEYPKPQYPLKIELNDFLLRIRNGIAHGNYPIQVNITDVERSIKVVEELMFLVYNSINEGYNSCCFL